MRFLAAILLAVLVHLLLLGILAGVLEVAMPSSAPEIQAVMEMTSKVAPSKVSKPMATEVPVSAPPPPDLDFSVNPIQLARVCK